MASIENRSRYVVTVRNHSELTRSFARGQTKAVAAYVDELKTKGYKPKLTRENDSFAVRVREVGYPDVTVFATSEAEAVAAKQKIESERRQGLFVDYGMARRFTFGDLLARYLREESPRHKGFETEGYNINAVLEDAGLPRVDIATAYAEHKNPHPCHANKKFRKPNGKKRREPTLAARFVRKSFADVQPSDFHDYIDDRSQEVAPATVDRALDLFSAVCRMAIDTWRIPIAQNPLAGVRRPKYFNERDRRLKPGEEERLLAATRAEDKAQSIAVRLETLMSAERAESNELLESSFKKLR